MDTRRGTPTGRTAPGEPRVADRGGRSRMVGGIVALWAFAAVLTVALGGITSLVWPRTAGGDASGLIALAAFWLLPVFAIGVAALQTATARRLAASSFEPDGPAALGGVLSGSIHVPGSVRRARGLEIRLECRERVVSRSGASPDLHTVVVRWCDGATLDPAGLEPSPHGAAIPVAFDLPGPDAGARASEGQGGAVTWVLLLLADLPRLDGVAEFPVEVRPAAAEPAPAREPRRMPRLERPSLPASSAIRARPLPGGTAYLLPTIPWAVWVVPVLLAAAVARFRHAPLFAGSEPLPWAIGAAAAFEAILAIAAISSTSRIELFPEELRVRTGVRFLGQWQAIRRADILEIRSQAGTANVVKYEVRVRTTAGDRVVAANLDRLGDAEWLVAELKRWKVS